MPFSLSGSLNANNKNALDWLVSKMRTKRCVEHFYNSRNERGLLAYANQSTLIVVDVATLKVVQTLTKHYSPVTHVRLSS